MGSIRFSTPQPMNALIDFEFDAIKVVTKDADGQPTQVEYYKGGLSGTLIATLDITYDVDGDLATVVRTDA